MKRMAFMIPLMLIPLTACTLNTASLPYVEQIEGIEFSTGDLQPSFQKDVRKYEVSSLNALNTIQVKVNGQSGHKFELNGTEYETNTWVPLKVNELSSGADIAIRTMAADGQVLSYSVATLPSDFPPYQVQASNPAPGQVLFGTMGYSATPKQANFLIMTDELGKPLYYKKSDQVIINFMGFKNGTGEPRYTYHETIPAFDTYEGGVVKIMDKSFKVIKEVNLIPYADRGNCPENLHDFVYFDDNHYMLMGYCPFILSNLHGHEGEQIKAITSVIQEIKDGQVVFDWDSRNFVSLFADSNEVLPYEIKGVEYSDYIHINSINIDPNDGNVIASFRNNDEVIKIDRKTGKILWVLGGKSDQFGLTEAQKFSHQHSAVMHSNHVLTIFDNGNINKTTRILSLTLDEQNKKVTSYAATQPHPGLFAPFMGNIQKRGDLFFVGWGGRPTTPDTPDITEYNPQTMNVSFSLFLPRLLWSYRAFKFNP